jgi:hypothetical protein
MTPEQFDKAIDLHVRSAAAVLIRALRDKDKFRGDHFLISPADEVELRDILKNWALARRQD